MCRLNGIDPGFPGNIIQKTRIMHEAWHGLFGTLLPWEVSELLRETGMTLKTKRQRRWFRLIFGVVSFTEAADIVEREWTGLYSDEVIERLKQWRNRAA